MADTIQVKIPAEMLSMIDDLKAVRSKCFEQTSITSIVMDALKAFHKSRVKK